MSNFIPITKPWLIDEDINAVSDVLKTGMLVQGQEVEKLEIAVADYLNVKQVIAVSNGTATMHIMLKVLGIGPGDEVIVPAFSYVATANVVELVGATPVFVDIDINTFNIDTKLIEQKLTPKTKAILAVHEFGLAANVSEINKICKKYNYFFLEDAACALGACIDDKKTGSFGHSASFSLHPRKAITSGEGGLIATNDIEFANKCKILRNHGVDMTKGKTGFVEAGFNYRMTDFQAALVASQFNRFEEILSKKNEITAQYFSEIKNPKVILPYIPNGYTHSLQSFHLILNGISQNEAIEKLKLLGVGANYGAQCIPEVMYYKNKYGYNSKTDFPNALKAFDQGLVIPLFPQMQQEDINKVISAINQL
jgi:dTDP-4-amino-4,6-dideoxygalactose transaminase